MSNLKIFTMARSWNPNGKKLPFHLALSSASKQLCIPFYKDLQAEYISEKEEAAEKKKVYYNISLVNAHTHTHTRGQTHTRVLIHEKALLKSHTERLTKPLRVVISGAVKIEETHFLKFAFLCCVIILH